jgi:hypothetical protein
MEERTRAWFSRAYKKPFSTIYPQGEKSTMCFISAISVDNSSKKIT